MYPQANPGAQWTYADVQKFVDDFKAVFRDRKNHYYHQVRCVYGRKPFPHEEVEGLPAEGRAPAAPPS